MTAILAALPWRWVGLGVAILGAWLYVAHLWDSLDAAEQTVAMQRAQLDQIQAANASLEASLSELTAQHAREVAALTSAAQAAALRASRTAQTIQVIRNAPASDDAPVAPVLSRALDGLRRTGTEGDRPKPGGAP
ncbi:MAG: hypothetical protein ACOVVK_11720 [Elsteraceae bacterium]